tara:strand:- start:99 stop:1013 length:915 start_codon:yes stop_codon:yes gene_type:complete
MRYANIGNYIKAGSLGAAGALGALAATQASSPSFADQQRLAMNLQGQREVLVQDLENPANAYLSKVGAAKNAAAAAKLSYERKEIENAKFQKRKAGKIALAAQLAKKPVLEPEPFDASAAYAKLEADVRRQAAEQRDKYDQDYQDYRSNLETIFGNRLDELSKQNLTSVTPLTQSADLNNDGKLLPAISMQQARQYAIDAGATPAEARTLAAIAAAESGLVPNNDTIKSGLYHDAGETSYGLWQINMTGDMRDERLKQFGINTVNDLYDPLTNAKAAVQLMRNRGGFGDWTTYTDGKHLPYMNQ